MSDGYSTLLLAALGAAFVHTLVGLDHVVPFVALGRARAWSLRRTLAVTAASGAAHVGASALLGLVALVLGMAAETLGVIALVREAAHGWLLVGLGLTYACFALWRLRRRELVARSRDGVLGGALVAIFALGPCESLIPMMLHPSVATDGVRLSVLVGLFALATVATMVGLVAVGTGGASVVPWVSLRRYGHVAAGLVIAGVGAAWQL